MLYNSAEVQVIKLAVCNIESLGLTSREVLLKSISLLREKYEDFSDEKYLKKAVWHIYAYLELGYPYDSGKQEFRKILGYLELNEKDIFPASKWIYKKVLLSKANVRKLLGRWNPKLHCMKINDAVSDIINKVETCEEGEYLYYSGKVLKQDDLSTLWEQTYKLYIRQDESVFHDINKNKYYVFTQERSK